MEEALPEIKQEEWNIVMAMPEKQLSQHFHSWAISKNVWEKTPLAFSCALPRDGRGWNAFRICQTG